MHNYTIVFWSDNCSVHHSENFTSVSRDNAMKYVHAIWEEADDEVLVLIQLYEWQGRSYGNVEFPELIWEESL